MGEYDKYNEFLINNYKKFDLDDEYQIQLEMDTDEKTKYIWYRHSNAISFVREKVNKNDIVLNDVNFENFGYITHKNK